MAESSHEQFANNFGSVASRQTARCVLLAVRFPAETPSVYFTRLWDALADKDCDLESCSAEAIAALLAHAKTSLDRNLVISACRTIEHHPYYDWNEFAWQLLEYAAHHQNPEPDQYTIHSGRYNEMQPDVESTSLNCVRGVAAAALAALVWDDKVRCDKARQIALNLANDPHPSVRMAAAHLATAAYTVDRDLGIDLLHRIINTTDAHVLAGYWLNHLISCVRWCDRQTEWTKGQARGRHRILKHWKLLKWKRRSSLPALFWRMSQSDDEEVARRGVHWVTAERLQFGLSWRAWRACARGTTLQKKAIAETLCELITDDAANCDSVERLLVGLFADGNKEVRSAAANVFRRSKILDEDIGARLATAFVCSRAFAENSEELIRPLSNEAVELVQYRDVVLASADRFAYELAEKTRDIQHGMARAGREQSSLLLRLYDAATKADDRALAETCLDRWDALLQNRVGQAEAHLEAFSN